MTMMNPLLGLDVSHLSPLTQAAAAAQASALMRANQGLREGSARLAEGARNRMRTAVESGRAQNETVARAFSEGMRQGAAYGMRKMEIKAGKESQQSAQTHEDKLKTKEINANKEAQTADNKAKAERQATEIGAAKEAQTSQQTHESDLLEQKNQAEIERLDRQYQEAWKARDADYAHDKEMARLNHELQKNLLSEKLPYTERQGRDVALYMETGNAGPFTQALRHAYYQSNPQATEDDFRADLATGAFPGDQPVSGRNSELDNVYMKVAADVYENVLGTTDSSDRARMVADYLDELPALIAKTSNESTRKQMLATADALRILVDKKRRDKLPAIPPALLRMLGPSAAALAPPATSAFQRVSPSPSWNAGSTDEFWKRAEEKYRRDGYLVPTLTTP